MDKTLLGLDIIADDHFKELKNKRVGLITNYSGVSSNLESNIELMLKDGIKIQKIFTPEHGLFGLADGVQYGDTIHPKYKIRIISLYGEKKAPQEEDLRDIDILMYDIQKDRGRTRLLCRRI
jgi:uncharacterized protein YbbC (DUF1343 family)